MKKLCAGHVYLSVCVCVTALFVLAVYPSVPVCVCLSRRTSMVDAATSVKFGTWNVRSMVDTAGCVEVASCHAGRGEDCKVDLVISEQARYVIVVGALQETKWFGNEVYEVADSVVLTSGRRTPM